MSSERCPPHMRAPDHAHNVLAKDSIVTCRRSLWEPSLLSGKCVS